MTSRQFAVTSACAVGVVLTLAGCAAPSRGPIPADPNALAENLAAQRCNQGLPGSSGHTFRECVTTMAADIRAGRTTDLEPFRRAELARDTRPAIDRWRFTCTPLRAEAAVQCEATLDLTGQPLVRVTYFKRLDRSLVGPLLFVGTPHDCPGYDQVVRVDRNPPIRIRRLTGRDTNIPGQAQLARQMDTGTSIAVDSYQWPTCAPRSTTQMIPGFGEAHARVRQMAADAVVD